MSAITLTAASWISYLAQTTAANRAAVVAGWFPSGATIEFLDASGSVIRTVTTASWSVGAVQTDKYPVVPGTYTDSATGSGTPVTAVFKDGSTERFRCTCGTDASNFYRLSANIVAGVPIRRGSFALLIGPPPSAGLVQPTNTNTIVISGSASVGSVLTATPGTWTGNPVPTVTRQWYRSSSAISGATGLAYTLTEADIGTIIMCRETAVNTVATITADSNTVGPIVSSSFAFTVPSSFNIPQGGTYSLEQHVSGGTPPYSDYTVETGVLPSGVTLNSASGILSASESATLGESVDLRFGVSDSTVSATLPVFGVLSSLGGSNLPFTYGHTFKQGDVPTGTYVDSDLTDWQVVPTTYWSDGSLRHAIIAGRVTCSATVLKNITLSVSSSDRSGSVLTETNLASTMPTVTLTAGGDSISLNSLIGTAAKHRTVCSGPVMSNWIYRKAISGSTHLVAWFDVRLYVGGEIEIFPWIENGYLTVSGPTNDVRTYTFTIGGVQRFTQSIDIKHHTRVPLLSGSVFSYWVGTDPQMVPKHDVSYLRDTKMVTNNVYPPSEARLATTSEFPQTYTPNWLGTTKAAMASTGYGNHIGPFPNWQAGYIASGDARAYRATIVNGMAAGSWPVHFRAESTSTQGVAGYPNEPIKYSLYPNVSIDWSGSPTIPQGTGSNNIDETSTQASPDRAHQPSLAYLPWLLTGRWFFLDEQLFWVTWSYLKETNYSSREGAKGLWLDGQIRSRGWHARSHAQLLASLPTSHPCFDDIKYTWEENCAAYEARYITGTRDSGVWVNNLGCLGLYSGASGTVSPYGTAGDYWWDAPWMQDTLIIAFGLAREMDVPQSSASKASHIAVSNFGYKHAVGLAGGNGATEHSYRYFGEFETPYATNSSGLPPESWLSDWGASLAVRKTYGGGQSPGALPNLSYAEPSSVYYGSSPINAIDWAWHSAIAFHLGSLALAVEHEAPGAAAAWARITSATNFSTSGFDLYSIWGYTPRSAAPVETYGLLFPSNISGGDQLAPYVALKFSNPHTNGLPIWGPGSGASRLGVTYIWEYQPEQQTGYYVTFWWSNDGSFLWDGGSSNTYVGAHPYPQNSNNTGTSHYWEIAGMGSGADYTDTLAGSKKTVVKGVKYLQALRITVNPDGSKTARFYTSLPSIANADIIQGVASAGWGEVNPPSPALTFGDSPWYASFQHERMSGILGRVKIISKSLSEADMLLEAANMNALVTPDASSYIWWGKNTFDSVDDLTCDYGTGRTFQWADPANKATRSILL